MCRATIVLAAALLWPLPAAAAPVSEAWQWPYTSPEYADKLDAIALDAAGAVYVGGWPGVFKLSPGGALVWQLEDARGLLAVTGDRVYVVRRPDNATDATLAAYTLSGAPVWSWRLDDPGYESTDLSHLAATADGGVVAALAGRWSEDLQQHTRAETIRLDAQGALLWRSSASLGCCDLPAGVAVDSRGRSLSVMRSAGGLPVVTLQAWDEAGALRWQIALVDAWSDARRVLGIDSSDCAFVLTDEALYKVGPNGQLRARHALAPGYTGALVVDPWDRVTLTTALHDAPSLITRLDHHLRHEWTVAMHPQEQAADVTVDWRGYAFVAGHSHADPWPRMITHVVTDHGDLDFCEACSAVIYGYAVAIAVDPRANVTVVGETWVVPTGGYDGVVVRYSPLPGETPSGAVADVLADLRDLGPTPFDTPRDYAELERRLVLVRDLLAGAEAASTPETAARLEARAYQRLAREILPHLDGCASGGAADATDWLDPCELQLTLYEPLAALLDAAPAL